MSYFCPSTSAALRRVAHVPPLGSTVGLALVAKVQLSHLEGVQAPELDELSEVACPGGVGIRELFV